MRKLFALILACILAYPVGYYGAAALAGGNIYWEGDDSNDWATGSNWYGGSAPGTGDTAYFHGDSADAACTLSAAIDIAKLYFDATNDVNFSQDGNRITVSGDIYLNGAGGGETYTLDSAIEQDADGNLTLESGPIYSISSTACDVDLQGMGNFQNNSGGTLKFHKITGAANTKTTTHDGSATIECVQWTLGDGKWTNSRQFNPHPTSQSDFSFNASHTIDGSAHIYIYPQGAITFDIPVWNGSGHSGRLLIDNETASTQTWNMQGAINNSGFIYLRKTSTGALTVNTNNNNITSSALNLGNNNATGPLTYNMGSATVDISGALNDQSAASTMNAQTSTWQIGGNFALSGIVWAHGTESVTLDGSGAQSLDMQGDSLYDLTIANTGNTVSLAADIVVAGDFDHNDGAFDAAGYKITCLGDYLVDCDDAITWDDTIAMEGNNATLHIGSTVPSVTATSGTIHNTGTAPTVDIDKACTFGELTQDAGIKTTLTGAADVTYTTAPTNGSIVINQTGATSTFGGGCTLDTLDINAGTMAFADSSTLAYYDVAGGEWNITGDTIVVTDKGTGSTAGGITGDAASLLSFTADGARIGLFPGDTIPKLQIDGTCYIDSGGSIADLAWGSSNDSLMFQPLKKYAFLVLDSAQVNGVNGSLNRIYSQTSGQRDTLDFPSTMYFSYTRWRDQISDDTVYVNDGTNLSDGGNLWP